MQYSNVWLATALLNDRVRNSAGEDLGRIEDLAIDPETGSIQYAILSFGGLLGVGNKLFPIPWSSLRMSASRDHVLFDIDKETIRRAPSFERDAWPDWSDPVWQRDIYDHYGRGRPVVVERPVVSRPVYSNRRVATNRGISAFATVVLVCLLVVLGWVVYLVSTRGWDQAREDMRSTFQTAAYAAKETSHEAALTTKIKTALSLSKRIPSDKINVDTEGSIVTLRGEVPSGEIRQLAEQVVRDVPGVSEVHNHLFAISGSQ
jgi:sporulation protein YlmC with PRC-barrel domain